LLAWIHGLDGGSDAMAPELPCRIVRRGGYLIGVAFD
jgi:hypothetical protein